MGGYGNFCFPGENNQPFEKLGQIRNKYFLKNKN